MTVTFSRVPLCGKAREIINNYLIDEAFNSTVYSHVTADGRSADPFANIQYVSDDDRKAALPAVWLLLSVAFSVL